MPRGGARSALTDLSRAAKLAFGFGCVVSWLSASLACNPPSEPVVLAIINGKPITEAEFDYRWAELPASTQARYRQEGGKRKFLDDLITKELLLQEVRKRGLDQSPSVRERLVRLKEQVLLDELTRQVLDGVGAKDSVSEDELDAYFTAHASKLLANEQIKIAHIVVTTIEQAQEIKKQLDQGYDWSKLAERNSTDTTTKFKGGELGIYRKGILNADLDPILLKLKTGRVSDPIKMPSGIHLIKVLHREVLDRDEAQAARERLQREIHAEKSHKRFEDFVAKLKSNASVRIADASRLMTDDDQGRAKSKP
jgi:peptidyl-prolyl cis-trans isomerase C